jgi:hypothetical protein
MMCFMRVLLFIAGVCTLVSAQQRTTLHLIPDVTLDVIDLPGRPVLSFGRTPVTIEQFRAFIEATGYITDAENPKGNGPGRVGGHGWNADKRRPEGWFPRYTVVIRPRGSQRSRSPRLPGESSGRILAVSGAPKWASGLFAENRR